MDPERNCLRPGSKHALADAGKCPASKSLLVGVRRCVWLLLAIHTELEMFQAYYSIGVTSRVRFGLFDFDPSARALRREGVPVRLQAQPAQVLAVLVEHAGELVTREQLRHAIWGTETFVDFDRGLNFCIAQIRSALGDSAESPRFVRTIPKQGYEFIAPLGPAEVSATAPASTAPTPRRSPKIYVLAAGLAVAVCALLALIIMLRPRTMNIAVARFDNETGSAEMDRFTDGLSDAVVADLTADAGTRYGIIGNAAILRRPRSQRDLIAIGSSLEAKYVVLGQVQRSSSHIRVLAHLIRLPEQTHLWVVRLDRDTADPLETESKVARTIADEFSRRLPVSSPSVFH
jgi:DNA-binding winged helix-turn-helix (wHTH) protein/TolB-like protein